ncbi:MAG TPA: four-carbon acid sugar kinase family protein, partial [Candidatus Limnocylindria bacterium]|nr:four-carbon acid sugar kinase family protein [Candidatus Limnocylindria bacterium]
MDPRALRVLADDLTGACDIATALLPWSGPVVVETHAGAPRPAGAALWVRNTQSRTLPVAEARRAVQQAVADAGAARAVVLKKIDTALRGHLGAELEAAMEAAGAAEVFVLPAIPAVGRTTVGGVQLLDGVPVHRTAFAADPLHPVDRSEVAAHVERGSSRRCRVLALEEVRSRARLAAAIERGREADETVFVCDAVTDDDLDAALAVLLERPRPLVLAGSLGLGRALRRRLAVDGSPAERPR